MVIPLKFTDAPVQVFKVLVLAFPFKLINFSFQAFPLLFPEKSASFTCNIFRNISINLTGMLQTLQLCLLPVTVPLLLLLHIALLFYSFTYSQSLSKFCNHHIVISVTVSSPDGFCIEYT